MHKTTLKALLNDRGIKQKWLAGKAGMTAAALNLIVHGKTLPTLRTAQRIARILHSTVEELWPYSDEDADA
jgi:putative transcriptional regulator